jgi:hypothetical protein
MTCPDTFDFRREIQRTTGSQTGVSIGVIENRCVLENTGQQKAAIISAE